MRYLLFLFSAVMAAAQTVTLNGFEVSTVATGLATPTTMAFLGPNDFLVLEKNTGKVLRFRNGRMLPDPVLDLSVNYASERGLLGIALHPRFASDRGVYLYWTCRSGAPGDAATGPSQEVCDESKMTGVEDTDSILAVPLRGNRVDRFTWDGERLTFDRNIVMLRSFQADGNPTPAGQGDESQRPAGNHDGGVIAFGPDGKLYVFFGDQGRRGLLQNLAQGPKPPTPDDQFGGPEPDDNHLSGVVLRLNPDGSAPDDNPFVRAAAALSGQAAANLRKVFAYGFRNSFGMTFDPFSGGLWITEHGDDSFDEINFVRPGMNGGWVQVAGPLSRIAEFKSIETGFTANPASPPSLQQLRWPPSRIADSAEQARSRMTMLEGASYADPQFSWRWAALPTALAFAPRNFGRDLAGHLLVAVLGDPRTGAGYLMRFPMHMNRRVFEFEGASLADRVADNMAKYDLAESAPLIVGSGFGLVTDMRLSPRNTIYVVSHSKGAVYEISRSGRGDAEDDEADMSGTGEPLRGAFSGSGGVAGSAEVRLNSGRELFCYEVNVVNARVGDTLALRQRAAGEDRPVLELPMNGRGQGAGCVSAGASVLRAIRANPDQFYLSVDGLEIRQSAGVAFLR